MENMVESNVAFSGSALLFASVCSCYPVVVSSLAAKYSLTVCDSKDFPWCLRFPPFELLRNGVKKPIQNHIDAFFVGPFQ
jgi:hypothetical protein